MTFHKYEVLRSLGDGPVDDTLMEVEEYGGRQIIRIEIDRALELIDKYIDIYRGEADNEIAAAGWTGPASGQELTDWRCLM